MKLLIIDTSPIIGGAETYLLELSRFLKKRHQLYFILSTKNSFVADFEQLGKVTFLETGDSLEKWRGLNLLSPFKPAAPSSNTDFDLVFIAGYLKDLFLFNNFEKPQILIFHTPPPGWLSKPPFKNLFARASKNLDKIVAVSDFNTRWLSKIISKEKIVTIKNGIDIKKFFPIKEGEKEKIKAQIPLPLDNIIIGNTSRIHKAKGQLKLIKIFRNLKTKYPNLSLLLINGGSRLAEKQLKKEIIKFELKQDVFWFGFQKNMAKFYQAMDIFVLPSVSENFPLTILEAMASGLPVIAFNTAGVKEETEDNKTGFLVAPDNLVVFEKKLEILIKNISLRKKFGQKGRLKIQQEFNQEHTFAKLEEIMTGIREKS